MKYKLSEIGRIVTGKTPSTKNKPSFSEEPDKYLFVTPRDMNGSEKTIKETERYLTDEVTNTFKNLVINDKSICVSCIGTIGKVFMPSGLAITNQQINSITEIKNFVLPDYLYYYLTIHQKDIENLAGGTTMPIVNKTSFEQLEVEIPDLETQQKIIRILSTLDEKIELNNKNNENLFEVIKGLFNRQFIGRIYGDKRISDYLIPRRGKNLLSKNAKKGNIPVIAGGLNPAAYHNQSNTLSPVVTISASGANAGYIRLWGENVWASDSSYIDNSITESVYFWYILLKIRQDEIYNKQIGSAQAHIYPRHIGEMGVGDIDCTEMLEYSKKVKVFFEKMFKNEQENKTLLLLRDTLLPKLISGEIKLDKISKE